MDKYANAFTSLAKGVSKTSKSFSSVKGNNAVIKNMQKGLGFNTAKSVQVQKIKKPVSNALLSKGSQAGVLKLGQVKNTQAPVDSTYVKQKGLDLKQRSYEDVFGKKPNPYTMNIKKQQTTAPTQTVQTKAPTTTKSTSNFNTAFADARKKGLSTFDFGGKKYNTQLKGETPKKDFKYVDEKQPNKTQSLVKNVKENTPITVTGQNKSTPIVARGLEQSKINLKKVYEMNKVSSMLGSIGSSIIKGVKSYGANIAKDYKTISKGTANIEKARKVLSNKNLSKIKKTNAQLAISKTENAMGEAAVGLGKRVGLPIAGGGYMLSGD